MPDVSNKDAMSLEHSSSQTQREKLLSAMKLAENEHAGSPVGTTNLEYAVNNVHDLYSATYRLAIKVPVTIVPLSDQRDSLPFPRAFIQRELAAIPRSNGKISGVKFGPEKILLFEGDPSLIYPKNTLGVYRAILAHEYVHGQTQNVPLVGIENPVLLPRDVRYGGDLLFVTGFKAVALGHEKDSTKPITQSLDEFITQYLSMWLYNSFDDKDSVVDGFMVHGKGISAEYVTAAYLLNDIFRNFGINHGQIEDYHFRSDIRGFIKLLDKAHPDLGRDLLRVGIDPRPNVALDKLKTLRDSVLNK